MIKSLTLALAACLSLGAGTGHAQTYPAQPIRVVAPYAPGGPVDMVARLLAQQLQEAWKQAVVVENRAGAGGNIGSAYVAKARPDGYTLLVNTSAVLIGPAIGQQVGFDPAVDLVPVVKMGLTPALLVVTPSFAPTSVGALVAYAKAHPGEVNFASPGPGSSLHLAAELFAKKAGIKLTHVPYKGGTEALPRLMAGDVQMMFDPVFDVQPLIKAGKLRAVAVSTKERSSLVPDVPTVAESGVPDYDFSVSYGLFAPKGTPPDVIDRLARETLRILAEPSIRKELEAKGIAVVAQGPREFARAYAAEQRTWVDLVSSTGLKIE